MKNVEHCLIGTQNIFWQKTMVQTGQNFVQNTRKEEITEQNSRAVESRQHGAAGRMSMLSCD